MTKVVHCKKDPYNVYIGRPSVFGNPFSHIARSRAEVYVDTRDEAVENYRKWVTGEIEVEGVVPPTMDEIKELKGKTLGCWCYPKACHGDVLVALAERIE